MSDSLSHLDDYPVDGALTAEAALATAWSALENFHDDLVVVGGLAIYLHTRNQVTPLYRPTPTLDVDFGITLGADAGMASPAGFALAMADFKEDEKGRLFRTSHHGKLYLDFLSESPPATSGTRNVSDLHTSIFPGINRALCDPIQRPIKLKNSNGDEKILQIPVANYGPLLVLKLNAFAKRTGPKRGKDAYDILTLVRSSEDGVTAVVRSFGEEKKSDNTGLDLALETLRNHFMDASQLGPTLADQFYHGPSAPADSSLRLREDLVTVALALINS